MNPEVHLLICVSKKAKKSRKKFNLIEKKLLVAYTEELLMVVVLEITSWRKTPYAHTGRGYAIVVARK